MFHFITGLPRAGTTLLGALLNQNPKYSGGMSTALFQVIQANIAALTQRGGSFSINLDKEEKERFLGSILDGWRTNVANTEVVFDFNRGWSSRLGLIKKISPGSKIVSCIRNPAWIMDSLERAYQNDPLSQSGLFPHPEASATVYSRARTVMSPRALLGGSLEGVKDAFFSPHSEDMLLLDYEVFTREPEQAMALIYQFLGEPDFQHDFENVEYDADAYDAAISTPGLHTVKKKVQFTQRDTVLPPDLFDDLSAAAFWTDLTKTNATAIVGETGWV